MALDQQAVRRANRELWDDNPELDGRFLTLELEDKEYRQDWWNNYNRHLKNLRKNKKPKRISGIIPKNNKTEIIKVNLEPKFTEGSWIGVAPKNTKYAYFGDDVIIHLKTQNIPDKTIVKLDIKEYDPTWLDWDEQIKSINAEVLNGEVNHQLHLKKDWYDEEMDGVNELYFIAKAEINGKVIEEEFPPKTKDYLQVVQKGVLITVIIKLPSENATGWEGKGLGGHTGVAIGNEFYDYGPSGNAKGSAGIPWWDAQIMNNSGGTISKVEDVDLPHVLNHIKQNIKKDVFTIEFFVSEKQALEIEKWWIDRYSNLRTYSVFPWSGEQCTTTVRISLERAGVIPRSVIQKPAVFLEFLQSNAENLAGIINGSAAKGTAGKVTQIQWENKP